MQQPVRVTRRFAVPLFGTAFAVLAASQSLACGDSSSADTDAEAPHSVPDGSTAQPDSAIVERDGSSQPDAGGEADGTVVQDRQDASTPNGMIDGGTVSDAGHGADAFFDGLPDCAGDSFSSRIHIAGELDGHAVSYDKLAESSTLQTGLLTTDNGTKAWVYLTWDGSLKTLGQVRSLSGEWLALPDEYTNGAGPYCVLAGGIAAAPSQPAEGGLVYFRITKVKKRTLPDADGVCTGPEIDTSISACLRRTVALIP